MSQFSVLRAIWEDVNERYSGRESKIESTTCVREATRGVVCTYTDGLIEMAGTWCWLVLDPQHYPHNWGEEAWPTA